MNTAGSSDAHKDPDRLEREIDEQRREINETLRALEEKFSSREIASQFMHYFGGPGREWAETLGSSVKANPIPTLLTGIGLTWLMMSDRNRSYGSSSSYGSRDRNSYGARDGMSYGPSEGTSYGSSEGMSYGSSEGMGGSERDGVMGSARESAESLRQRAGELGAKVSQAGETLRERAAHAGDALRSRTSHAREGFGQSSMSVRDNFENMVREQPLALGAVGIALGALIGAALPRTERESRVLGRASERVREQGKEMAREGYEKASRKVSEVAEAAGQTLQGSAEGNMRQADGDGGQDSSPMSQQPQPPSSGSNFPPL